MQRVCGLSVNTDMHGEDLCQVMRNNSFPDKENEMGCRVSKRFAVTQSPNCN